MSKILIPALASVMVALITTLGTIFASRSGIKENKAQLDSLQSETTTLQDLSRLPVGSILASMLSPSEFGKAVGDPTDFDLSRSRWTIADGKGQVPGTKWATITGNRPIPDLRGMFLRGLNLGRNDSYRDPDGDRKPGDPQSESFKKHSHDLPVGYHGLASGKGNGNLETGKRPVKTQEQGGDETRPNNVAVYYYLRIN